MFSTFVTVALFVSFTIQGASAGFAVNNPTLKQCTPTEISWSLGTEPYILEVVSATDPCGSALRTIEGIMSTVYEYSTSLAPGTKVKLYVSDNEGDEAWSGNITIGSGSTNCTGHGGSTPSGAHPAVIPDAQTSPSFTPPTPTITPVERPPLSSSTNTTTPLGGAINVGTSSGGVLTVHGASTPLLSIMALGILALTLA